MFRQKSFLFVMLSMFLLFGCEEDTPAPVTADPEITGSLVRAEGCKSGFTRGEAGSNSSCVTFTYDAAKQRLQLKHVNAAFNCCPEKIHADIVVEEGIIRIVESETGPNCRCNCLYDLDMVVENVPARMFTVVVEEPLRSESDPAIEFTMDLARETQGEHCVPRNSYPWGM